MAFVRAFGTEVTVTQKDAYERVICSLPKGIQMAFAYGSGVFKQTGVDMSKNMLDFIVVVDNPQQWHTENIAINKKHYSSLCRMLGPQKITNIQTNYGAGIYFNTLVPFENRLIKYGVIGTETLVSDLLNWDTLYTSGRLHKPVRIVKRPSSSQLISALHTNLRSALNTSLLLLPETFSELDLFTMITGLSYSGDFRMTFGEDKGKVAKIVQPNLHHFRLLYQPVIQTHKHLSYNENLGKFLHFQNVTTRFYHLNILPRCLIDQLLELKQADGLRIYPDAEEFIRLMAQDGNCREYVAESVANIVKKSSRSQSIKGILTAGLRKSVKYSYSKVRKMLKAQKTKS